MARNRTSSGLDTQDLIVHEESLDEIDIHEESTSEDVSLKKELGLVDGIGILIGIMVSFSHFEGNYYTRR